MFRTLPVVPRIGAPRAGFRTLPLSAADGNIADCGAVELQQLRPDPDWNALSKE